MVVSEQATRQFMLGISKVEQGYIEGKYRNKDEQDFVSKNNHEWYTLIAFERDLATHQLGQMAADRTSRVSHRIAELRCNLNFDIENAAYKAQKEIVEEFKLYVFTTHWSFMRLLSRVQQNQTDVLCYSIYQKHNEIIGVSK